ncbi:MULTISPECIES: putative quinol monooxygenase [Halorubrum]|uniref:Antibiotic biosynthesis monooxygenase n=1 Tax=Halorubrum hochstenium ATCC 700873 TaxID=1227481 RepID=M0FIB9_9EURY|nr:MULTISPECIES: putative quinol monooxygenase [Halorubrum]ELZ58349.1 Antibiotic biosynthesis monooxygenase [Halorubrum hochstenium ATCC 700873]
MLVVHAAFPIDPDRIDEALDHAETLVAESNREEGVIDYRAARDVENGATLRFFERYEDAEAFEAHSGTDHFEAFEAALPDLLAGEPEVWRFEVESAAQLDL